MDEAPCIVSAIRCSTVDQLLIPSLLLEKYSVEQHQGMMIVNAPSARFI